MLSCEVLHDICDGIQVFRNQFLVFNYNTKSFFKKGNKLKDSGWINDAIFKKGRIYMITLLETSDNSLMLRSTIFYRGFCPPNSASSNSLKKQSEFTALPV